MTREEYTIKLKKYLRKLPKQDYEDAIEYFNEYFSDTDKAGQQKLMEELGTPKEAAADLMSICLTARFRNRIPPMRIIKRTKKESLYLLFLQSCPHL